MAAPILEQGTTQRKVYFPQVSWINLHNGDRYAPGTHLIEDVKLFDPVPLFIREGTIIFTQDTEKVVNTKQLDNSFLLSTGLRYDSRRSNTTHKVYEAAGAILSISDYNDNSLVDICYREGCNYIVTMIATISSSSRILELDITYLGGVRLNQEIRFFGINMGFGEEVIEIRFDTPYVITGPRRITLPIPVSSNLQT